MLLFDSKTNPYDKSYVDVYTIPGTNLEKELVCFDNYDDLIKNFTQAELERLKHHGFTPGTVKAERVWTSKGMMFYKPYMGDNDVKKVEEVQKSNSELHSGAGDPGIHHDDNLNLDLEGDGKHLWKYSYLQNEKDKKDLKIKDLMDYKIHDMLAKNKLYYDPNIGFVRNMRLIQGVDMERPLLRSEEHPIPTKIIHYSEKRGLTEVNPEFMVQHGKPAIFYISKLEDPRGAKAKYTVSLPEDHNLYDIHSDKDRIIDTALEENDNVWDTVKILKKIKDAGYHGIWAPKSNHPVAKNMIQLFYSHKPEMEEML